jgi:hypothetical protein
MARSLLAKKVHCAQSHQTSMDENADLTKPVLEIKRDVMRYLINHPDAKDTVAGILHWWLPGTLRQSRAEDVLVAMKELLETGWVTRSSFGGTTVYGLDCSRRHEIQRWLES